MNELSATEKVDLQHCEKTIEKTKDSFFECGMAMRQIKEDKLYKGTHSTFDGYCKERWGWERTYAHRLIEAATIKMLPIGNKIKNEAQARALAAVPGEEREKVMERAVSSGSVTAASITEAAKEQKIIELDKTQTKIPEHLLPLWNRSGEVKEMVAAIVKIKSVIRRAQEEKDLLYSDMNFSRCLSHLENSHRVLQTAIPFAVCWSCSGVNSKKCTMCKGMGMVSEFSWSSFAPTEIKAMRVKVNKKK